MKHAMFLWALVFVGLVPGYLWAQEGGGSENVDLFGWAVETGVWTLVVFGVLLLVLRKYAWTPMLEGLTRREVNIHNALDEAQKAREESQRLRDQYQREMDHAQDKVREILESARKDAEHTTEEMVAKARSEIQAERERLRREIDMARDQALQELWNQTARLATLVSAKVIRREISQDDHRRLLDESLAEMKDVGKNGNRKLVSGQA